MQNIKELTLDNGMRLVAVDAPGRFSAVMEVFVQIGSMYELKKEFGMSHFLEHMAFKGSQGHPKSSDLMKELDSAGVSYNAGTGLESTSYFIKCLPSQLSWASEILSDILLQPLFLKEELEKERGVIEEEIAMYQDNPAMGLASEFMQKVLSSGEVGCWNIIGSRESLAEIDSATMHEFRKSYFDAKRCIGLVVVDFKKIENIENMLQKFSRNWLSLGKSVLSLPKLETKPVVADFKMEKDLEQAHLCVGFPGVSRSSEERYIARIIDILLAGNFSSRLVSLLREELGVAYYVQSISEQLSGFGIGGVQAGVKSSKAGEVLDRCKQEIGNLSRWITPEALERTKDYLVGNTLHQMDKVSFWSDFIGHGLLLDNEVPDLDQEIVKYKAVNMDQIVKYCDDKLKTENLSSILLAKK